MDWFLDQIFNNQSINPYSRNKKKIEASEGFQKLEQEWEEN